MLEINVVLREILTRVELAPAAQKTAPAVRRVVTLAPRGGGRIRVLAKHAQGAPSRETATPTTAWSKGLRTTPAAAHIPACPVYSGLC